MKKKLLLVSGLIFIFLVLILISINQFKKKKKTPLKEEKKIEEESTYNSNKIQDKNYTSKDLKGNKYTILADEGEIDLNNSDIIYLTGVSARIEIKDKNEVITITSTMEI